MKKLFIPEAIQTSSLDCGPAALKALLAGFGQPADYEELREACQTGLDGTAMETLETVAAERGLTAEQIMLPLDHLARREAGAFPAIVVVTVPPGLTHFVVVWRRLGNWLQIMDPAVGRRWVHVAAFLAGVYLHRVQVDAADWFAFASSEDFERVFRAREKSLKIRLPRAAEETWCETAARVAALQVTEALVRSGGIRKGRRAQAIAAQLLLTPESIPSDYFPVTDTGEGEVEMRGAVLLRVRCARAKRAAAAKRPEAFSGLWRGQGVAWPLLAVAALTGAAGTFMEALLFRGLLDINGSLKLAGQRMGAVAAALTLCLASLLLEFPAFVTGVRLGRLLENRFRILFLEKLARLGDGYFRTRAIADLAERSHVIHRLRHLPDQVRRLLSALAQFVATAAGVAWLEPRAWKWLCLCLAGAFVPLVNAYWVLPERALRMRTHSGALMRYYLDAMLGLVPIRMHGAAERLRRQQENLLREWAQSGLQLQRALVLAEGLQLGIMFAAVAALLLEYARPGAEVGRILLVAYWALNLPALGQQIATIARQYPNYRGIVLRLMEPLNATEGEPDAIGPVAQSAPRIELDHVTAAASGNAILTDVSLTIEAGTHVAIAGPSGAGKSSLAGLLLGWLKPQSGAIHMNGQPLNVALWRSSTAWVDPAVQIWNEPLLANLLYGADGETSAADAVEGAALRGVLEKLPDGLRTKLGENGGLVSGGEGQRVRFGRALGRKSARLVILDEPFRGLDRSKRRELLRTAREHWAGATLLCITHDIAETKSFDQVVVMEGGRIVEAGPPRRLAQAAGRYAQMLAVEQQVRSELWESFPWRRITLTEGALRESPPVLSQAASAGGAA